MSKRKHFTLKIAGLLILLFLCLLTVRWLCNPPENIIIINRGNTPIYATYGADGHGRWLCSHNKIAPHQRYIAQLQNTNPFAKGEYDVFFGQHMGKFSCVVKLERASRGSSIKILKHAGACHIIISTTRANEAIIES